LSGWPGRTRAGAINASAVSCSGLACPSRQPRSAPRYHCRGFADLLERATIGELWLTPRVFRDNTNGELSEDAQAYCDEAMRRVKKTIASGGVARRVL
jgi:hypothetical protein